MTRFDWRDPETLRTFLDYDPCSGSLTWKKRAGVKANWNTRYAGRPALRNLTDTGYFAGYIMGRHFYAHRAAWAIVHGHWPEYIDHLDRNKTNNAIANLREVTNQENMRNASMSVANTSGITGVYWYPRTQRWTAKICVDHRSLHLGTFDSKEEAAAARKAAEARFNFHPNHGNAMAA